MEARRKAGTAGPGTGWGTAPADTPAAGDIAEGKPGTVPADNRAVGAAADKQATAADMQAETASELCPRQGSEDDFDLNTDNYYSCCLNVPALYRVPKRVGYGRDFPTPIKRVFSQSRVFSEYRIVERTTGCDLHRRMECSWFRFTKQIPEEAQARIGGHLIVLCSAAARISSLPPRSPQNRLKPGNHLSTGSCLRTSMHHNPVRHRNPEVIYPSGFLCFLP